MIKDEQNPVMCKCGVAAFGSQFCTRTEANVEPDATSKNLWFCIEKIIGR